MPGACAGFLNVITTTEFTRAAGLSMSGKQFPYSCLPPLKIFNPSGKIPELGGGEGRDIPFRAEQRTAFYFLHTGQLCVPMLLPSILRGRRFSGEGRRMH